MIATANRLCVALEGVEVLKDVSFSVSESQWIGLLGPNGAGKTTLLRCLGGLIHYRGELTLSGREVRDWPRRDLARKLAFVRQSVPLAFDFRVDELVLLGRSPHKRWHTVFSRDDRELAEEALDRVDLRALSSRSIHSLSSGERQRVFLAQALTQEPSILLLDEPTAHLDIHHQFSFLGHVREHVGAGLSVVAAFHDLELAAQFADQLLILHKGRVAAFGPPSEVLTSKVIADVYGVDATVSTDGDRITGVRYHGNISRRTPDVALDSTGGPQLDRKGL
ncbi:MAG: ABC transporter ATP-binding protein [Rhodothermales bacterium]|nr:ABC transporter ATP-binding protein [Rhodothermales bacterium]